MPTHQRYPIRRTALQQQSWSFVLLLTTFVTASAYAATPIWKPSENVEIVVGAAAGGGNDNVARTLQKIMHERRLVEIPISVTNKPGGGGAIAFHYVSQHPGNAHYIGVNSNTLLTNQITGKSQISYTGLTPLAVMINEYITFVVKADSPLRTGQDLIGRLKQDPTSVVFGISSALGNVNHIAVAAAAHSAGIDVKRLKVVVFSGSGQSITALLGGHVDVVAGPPSIAARHIEAGKLRAIAVTSPRRLEGSIASVPTWKEQGIDVEVTNWRGIVGPKGISTDQIAYWDQVLAKVSQTEDWNRELQKNLWGNAYTDSKGTERYMRMQYGEFKRILTELGLAE